MKWIFLVLLALVASPAVVHAQQYEGDAMAVDGDSLSFTGFDVTLYGIDAPEALQTCQRGNDIWLAVKTPEMFSAS